MAKVVRVSGWAIDLDRVIYISPVEGREDFGYYFQIQFVGKEYIRTSSDRDKDLVSAERELLIAKWENS